MSLFHICQTSPKYVQIQSISVSIAFISILPICYWIDKNKSITISIVLISYANECILVLLINNISLNIYICHLSCCISNLQIHSFTIHKIIFLCIGILQCWVIVVLRYLKIFVIVSHIHLVFLVYREYSIDNSHCEVRFSSSSTT